MCDRCPSSRAILELPLAERAAARRARIEAIVAIHGEEVFAAPPIEEEESDDAYVLVAECADGTIGAFHEGVRMTTSPETTRMVQATFDRQYANMSSTMTSPAPPSGVGTLTITTAAARPRSGSRAPRVARRQTTVRRARSPGQQDPDPEPEPPSPRALRTRALLRRIQARGPWNGYRPCFRDLTEALRYWEAHGIVEQTEAGWRLTPAADLVVGYELRRFINASHEAVAA